MKAISIKQPWAELIIRGIKRIEIRTWRTNYRGKLLIHASKTIDREALEFYGFKKEELITGAIIGEVEIVGIKEYNSRDEFERDFNLHRAFRYPNKRVYGWILKNPKRYERPIYMKGKLGLFDVSIEKDLLSFFNSNEGNPARVAKNTNFPIGCRRII